MKEFDKKDLDLLFNIIHDFFSANNQEQAYGLMAIYDMAADSLELPYWHEAQEAK